MRKAHYYDRLQRWGYVFILPTVILFSIFLIFPMIDSFRLSLFKWNLVGTKIFVGFENFSKLFKDKRFWNSYLVTLHFTFLSVIILMFISFWLSLALTSRLIRFKSVFQSMIFLPVVLAMVAIAVVWRFMFQTTGLLSILFLDVFGLNIPWLSSTKVAPYAVILVNVWKYTGYYMVMFIAGLLEVPEVYYEAARIDGAGFWGRLIYITLPSLKNTLILIFVSCVIFSFGTFALQYVMTEGGPSRSTEVLALLIYKEAFEYTKFGYAAAISVIFFITLLIFSIIQVKIFKSRTVY
ncbi:MAG: sugar ABC transporter permease [Spirochaetes bacterium]|nr:MAG: sugar ABC transporter permease [Spirochaetota bacterium]